MGPFRLVLLSLLTTAVVAVPDSARSQGEDMGVPLSRTSSGLITAPVTIGGRTFTFLLDTGSARSVLTAGTARALKLKTFPGATMINAAGRMAVHHGYLDELTIGNVTVRRHLVIVADLSGLGRELVVDGILGADVLLRGRMRLDIENGRLWLSACKPCPPS